MPSDHHTGSVGFLTLPGEIRNIIYELVLLQGEDLDGFCWTYSGYDELAYYYQREVKCYKACSLAQTCQQIGREMASMATSEAGKRRLAFEISLRPEDLSAADLSSCICDQPVRTEDIVRFSPITTFLSSLKPAEKLDFLSRPLQIVLQRQGGGSIFANYESCRLVCILAELMPEVSQFDVRGLLSKKYAKDLERGVLPSSKRYRVSEEELLKDASDKAILRKEEIEQAMIADLTHLTGSPWYCNQHSLSNFLKEGHHSGFQLRRRCGKTITSNCNIYIYI